MAEKNIGKITQIIGAVLDIKFQNEMLPEINSAINITRSNGERLVVEVAQHLGDDTVRWSCQRNGCRSYRCSNICSCW